MARAEKVQEQGTQGSLVERPSMAMAVPIGMLTEDAGLGMEEATSEDIAIPFLSILQKGSPQVDPAEGAFIDGAKPGQVFNSVTGELFEDGIDVIPCYFRREIVEWRLREKGGGFVAVHPKDTPLLDECRRDEKNRDVRPGGETHLVVTANHYVMLADGQRAVISMSSTQLKKSRKWLTLMAEWKLGKADGTSFNPPTYARAYHLSTVPEKNDKGAWMGWAIQAGPQVSDVSLYSTARDFAALVRQGKVRPSDGAADPADE